jgi:hypothetical protein
MPRFHPSKRLLCPISHSNFLRARRPAAADRGQAAPGQLTEPVRGLRHAAAQQVLLVIYPACPKSQKLDAPLRVANREDERIIQGTCAPAGQIPVSPGEKILIPRPGLLPSPISLLTSLSPWALHFLGPAPGYGRQAESRLPGSFSPITSRKLHLLSLSESFIHSGVDQADATLPCSSLSLLSVFASSNFTHSW